jgi:hypothetical protein
MSRIADDFDTIRARMQELREPEVCPACEGAGWECYGIGVGDPHFKVCEACHNPEAKSSP